MTLPEGLNRKSKTNHFERGVRSNHKSRIPAVIKHLNSKTHASRSRLTKLLINFFNFFNFLVTVRYNSAGVLFCIPVVPASAGGSRRVPGVRVASGRSTGVGAGWRSDAERRYQGPEVRAGDTHPTVQVYFVKSLPRTRLVAAGGRPPCPCPLVPPTSPHPRHRCSPLALPRLPHPFSPP